MLQKDPAHRWSLLKILNHWWFDIPSSTDVSKYSTLTLPKGVKFSDEVSSPLKLKNYNASPLKEEKDEDDKDIKIISLKRKIRSRFIIVNVFIKWFMFIMEHHTSLAYLNYM